MTREYRTIAEFYGDRRAKRSNVPLMNHINEGVDLLRLWGRSQLEIKAYCLHPIVQNSEPVDVSWSPAFSLAGEYRDRANSYLCRPETDYLTTTGQLAGVLGKMYEECAFLLLADKVQNQKDFRAYHWFTHKRRLNLEHYFNLWIHTLRNHYIGAL